MSTASAISRMHRSAVRRRKIACSILIISAADNGNGWHNRRIKGDRDFCRGEDAGQKSFCSLRKFKRRESGREADSGTK